LNRVVVEGTCRNLRLGQTLESGEDPSFVEVSGDKGVEAGREGRRFTPGSTFRFAGRWTLSFGRHRDADGKSVGGNSDGAKSQAVTPRVG
jgi:hypothetical protein